ncbi:biotin--[acetyl-CoA-carboxylase] ligase [Radiobacillus sp. PE A8.2]|uniref:biotin--[acetyl-CoA-carboxylase] ligase n=1 Tax=Radiobacillus sp. PE A8.2 TaxID=3380349 RepID=UPI003890E31A
MKSTRLHLIELLEENTEEYISGQELSRQLQISRTAVWKHMKELEKDGYIIHAVPKKGYQISKSPQKISANTIQWGLHTDWLGKEIIHKESVSSTQPIAHQLAMNGASHGTVVIADEQTKGKGRLERIWHSAANDGIWMSIILRPELQPNQAPQITLMAATVLADVIAKVTGIEPSIKWPNDLFVKGKKLAGILTEMQGEQDKVNYVILGIGMNVNQSKFPEAIASIATSLKLVTDKDWDIASIIQQLLVTFEESYAEFLANGFDAIKTKWEGYAYKIGETVTVKVHDRQWQAMILGIAEDGALRIINKDNSIQTLYSAEIGW